MSISGHTDRLLDRVVSGVADAAEVEAVDRLVVNDAEARAEYVRRMLLEIDLRQHVESEAMARAVTKLKASGVGAEVAMVDLQRDGRATSTPVPLEMSSGVPGGSWFAKSGGGGQWAWTLTVASVAACLVIVVTTATRHRGDSATDRFVPDAVARTDPTRVADSFALGRQRQLDQQAVDQQGVVQQGLDVQGLDQQDGVGGESPLLVVQGEDVFTTPAGADRVRFICGRGEYGLVPSHAAPEKLFVRRGQAVATLPVVMPEAEVIAGPLSITGSGASVGVSRAGDRVRVVVFSGEAVVRHADRHRPWRLTRDEGLEVLPDGTILSALVGGHQRFVDLQKHLVDQQPRLANANFQFPMLASAAGRSLGQSADRVPAGWTLVSHPVANADGMMSGGGLAIVSQAVAGGVNAGRGQAAYCEASMLSDGKTTWSSLYQAAGTLNAGDSIRLAVDVGPAGVPASGAAEGRVMLFHGEEGEGPVAKLAESVATLDAGRPGVSVDLRFTVPGRSSAVGRTLYVVLAAVPPVQPGTTRVQFRHVNLTVETEK